MQKKETKKQENSFVEGSIFGSVPVVFWSLLHTMLSAVY